MRAVTITELPNGLFLRHGCDDTTEIFYPAKLLNAYNSILRADVEHYKGEWVTSQDECNALREKLERATKERDDLRAQLFADTHTAAPIAAKRPTRRSRR